MVSAAKEWGISKKDYFDFCVKVCSDLKLDPNNYSSAQNRFYKKKISNVNQLRNLEEVLIDRVAETRNTIVAFIKQMEKDKLDGINNRLISLETQLLNDNKTVALNQLRSSVLMVDMLSQLIADSPAQQKEMFNMYMKRLNAQ